MQSHRADQNLEVWQARKGLSRLAWVNLARPTQYGHRPPSVLISVLAVRARHGPLQLLFVFAAAYHVQISTV